MLYNDAKNDRMIDTDIRNRLKAEIMSLTDEQVEYVIRRLHEVTQSVNFSAVGNFEPNTRR